MLDALEVSVSLGAQHSSCLLYTSDAADERSSVDLGGRRIIQKKKNMEHVQGPALWHLTNREQTL